MSQINQTASQQWDRLLIDGILTAEDVSQETLPWPDLVILDRDGVINEDSTAYIKSSDEWHPIAGSLEAIAALNQAGVPVAVATNQRGIALGLYDHQALDEMHQKMADLLDEHQGKIAALEYCTADDPEHPDRKPNPGMLHKIMTQLAIIPPQVIYFVGDKQSDLEAGKRAGIRPVLVRTGNGAETERKLQQALVETPQHHSNNGLENDGNHENTIPCFASLAEFVTILQRLHQ
ncbi:HAD-IIIA family hydrolase [Ignatzschineria larvae DSM 13226]|uniref:D,D-heptose 1,7-bisphosphate phosphatase n=1 Tax=Ignatzschineria larvae DSM 13226 TaxID=1111732 RepID=A0ABZ3C3R0_9GAMM|nr:HAD-IIIA family hydrolase [Ignatzschineria larvae]